MIARDPWEEGLGGERRGFEGVRVLLGHSEMRGWCGDG
jgi:hypothetical protein